MSDLKVVLQVRPGFKQIVPPAVPALADIVVCTLVVVDEKGKEKLCSCVVIDRDHAS